DLEAAIARGEFREDLYFRLNVIPIVVPPLRERREDIPALVAHFVSRLSAEHNLRPVRVAPAAMEVLQRQRWRGNIRELRNAVERLMIMAPGDTIRVEDLPADMRNVAEAPEPVSVSAGASPAAAVAAAFTPGSGAAVPVAPAGATTLRDFKDAAERAFLVGKLREHNWNISKTADVIDTPRSNLYKKLEQFGISQETDG
ncbi:MAG: helix-turn-helix domain-containing protein, partial [Alphaproteobacteria bacterium]